MAINFPNSIEHWRIFLIALGVKPSTASRYSAPFFEECKPEHFNKGAKELDDFMAEALHECAMLERVIENLNYSARRIRELGTIYGPGSRWARAAASADALAGDERALAEVIYGGRFGNRAPGDGWLYRGRGIPMVTFAANYERVGDLMGQDLLGIPQLLEQPRFMVQAAVLWWEDKIKDEWLDNQDRIRSAVQGGSLGLNHTRALAKSAREYLSRLA